MTHIDEPPSSPLSPANSNVSNIFTPRKSALYQLMDPPFSVRLGQDAPEVVQQGGDDSSPRSTRKRTASKRFSDDAEEPPFKIRATSKTPNSEVIESSASSTPSNMGSSRKQPLRGNWSVGHLMTDPKSKFGTIDLTKLLKSDRAWNALTREQQEKLILMLPGTSLPSMPDDELLPNKPKECLNSNKAFKADVSSFQEDLKQGRYDPKWLADAQTAMRKRANGDFDGWKEKNKEEFWGQKQKMDWTSAAGDSSQHDLMTLVKARYFRVGDVWSMRRGHGRGASAVHVEKEATITAISPEHKLSFRFAHGQHKLQTHEPSIDKDIRIDNVDGPIKLSNAVLIEDGRIVDVRGPNSWREFRCIRKNQDMGSLWDIRELYHSRLPR